MRQEYYYQYMTKGGQSAYRSMLDSFEAVVPELPVLNLDGRELSSLFFRPYLDHPSIFYIEGFNCRYTDNSQCIQLALQYMLEKKKIKEMKPALESRINRLVQRAGDLFPEGKEKYTHDFICTNVTYNKLEKQYPHKIAGLLRQGVGVCEGIAKTVKTLHDRMGMEYIIAISQADPEQGIRYRHAWNLVKLKNTWYHLGVTFDNSLGRYGQECFDYYNLDNRMMSRDRQPLAYGMPACPDGSRFYHKENRLSLTRVKDVSSCMKAALRGKQPYSVLHQRGGALNREVLERIVWIASKATWEKGKYIRLSTNYRQAVMEAAVLENQLQGTVCREEASEGESDGREK